MSCGVQVVLAVFLAGPPDRFARIRSIIEGSHGIKAWQIEATPTPFDKPDHFVNEAHDDIWHKTRIARSAACPTTVPFAGNLFECSWVSVSHHSLFRLSLRTWFVG